jgi:hypothetical protein
LSHAQTTDKPDPPMAALREASPSLAPRRRVAQSSREPRVGPTRHPRPWCAPLVRTRFRRRHCVSVPARRP